MKAITGIFGGGSKKANTPQAPKPEPVPVMPEPDDEAIKRARSRRISALMQRSGRTSTILSQGDGTGLGG